MARACTLLLFYSALVCLGIEDFKKRKIRNRYQGMILLLAVVSVITIPEISLASRALGMLTVSVPMVFLALFLPGSFGGGDVKLVFSCGAFLGWRLVGKGTALAILLAGIYSLFLMITKKNRYCRHFAFGPFLSTGFMFAAAELFSVP